MAGKGFPKGGHWPTLEPPREIARQAMINVLGIERTKTHMAAVAAGWKAPLSAITMPPDWDLWGGKATGPIKCHICGKLVECGYRKRRRTRGEKRVMCFPCSDTFRRIPENMDIVNLQKFVRKILAEEMRAA